MKALYLHQYIIKDQNLFNLIEFHQKMNAIYSIQNSVELSMGKVHLMNQNIDLLSFISEFL